jgi:GTP-binding protein
MKVTSAEFVKSAFERSHWPVDGRPEIAFLGRSNVGKSSLLNSLLQRKGLARTSNTPGRTQSINYFLVNANHSVASGRGSDKNGFYFVDLPGYGFAKVSKSMRADWGKMAEEYLSDREELSLSIQLVDSRHAPSKLDLQLHEWLVFNEKEHIVVATKSDKLSANELARQMRLIEDQLPGSRVIAYSAQTGKGRDRVWAEIVAALG